MVVWCGHRLALLRILGRRRGVAGPVELEPAALANYMAAQLTALHRPDVDGLRAGLAATGYDTH